jgi:pimeloyl-ACP methyl ester carboxylesterase
LLADDPASAPMLEELQPRVGSVVGRIAAGDHAGAAEEFVEAIALGPGSWAQLPREVQQVFIENAPTFLDEAGDPEQLAFDLRSIAAFPKPILVTRGDQSPPIFAPVVARLAGAAPCMEAMTIPGTGHVPHATHPDVARPA